MFGQVKNKQRGSRKMTSSTLKYGINYIKQFGLKTLGVRIIEKKRERKFDYQGFYEQNRVSNGQLEEQRMESMKWEKRPLVSIITPLYHTPEKFLRELIESVMASSYDNWQLCLVDATSVEEERKKIYQIVSEYQQKDNRDGGKQKILYEKLRENYGIAENTNRALFMAKGDYIAFLDHDDTITPDALYEMMAMEQKMGIDSTRAVMFYSDEDKMNEEKTCYYEPHFKPDYNPDLLCANNYITHFLMVSRVLLEEVGGIQGEFNGAQDYDFILRCTEKAENVVHIPKVLYHWRVHNASTSGGGGSKDYALQAGRRAIEQHLQRIGEYGMVQYTPYFGFYSVNYEQRNKRKITLIDISGRLDESVQEDQESEAYILFWDSSLKPLRYDWKEILMADIDRKGVGVVGGKIYNVKHRIEEAPYFVEETANGKALVNKFQGLRAGYGGYMHRANIQMDCDAVSGRCMLVKREVIEKIENYAEQITQPYFYEVVCNTAKRLGYRVMYEPRVEMKMTKGVGICHTK